MAMCCKVFRPNVEDAEWSRDSASSRVRMPCACASQIRIQQPEQFRRYIHIYIHTYTHTCMHAFIHTYTHTCMQSCIHAWMHPYIHACIHTCMHIHMHTYTHMHACIFRMLALIHASSMRLSTNGGRRWHAARRLQ